MLHRHPISTLFPYTTLFRSLKWFTEKKKPQKIKGDIEQVPVERIKERPQRLARGIYLSFIPVFKPNETSICRVPAAADRSEEHTSELQSRRDLVCRLLLEKK